MQADIRSIMCTVFSTTDPLQKVCFLYSHVTHGTPNPCYVYVLVIAPPGGVWLIYKHKPRGPEWGVLINQPYPTGGVIIALFPARCR